ncbi:MAG: phosphonate C-P lyase system protein PhnK [Pseudomonadota bacterium]|nr:phosphonate C-P lyase system protein PhnK [Pseudomonadota bacterium]
MSIKTANPLLTVSNVTQDFGTILACKNISFELFPGEVLGVVGESGSGKSTLLNCISGRLQPTVGAIEFETKIHGLTDIYKISEAERRMLMRTDWGFVHQNPKEGLRLDVSAGANLGERLMVLGSRHYAKIREAALDWLNKVEFDSDRIDDAPSTFSGGMQQRLQIARNLITEPRLVFMDEPTGGLDVSVQARLLDLIRGLVRDLSLSVIIVTHDLAVARLLTHKLMVMQKGVVVESGLTDQVLDDPQHPYSQLLVSSILQG